MFQIGEQVRNLINGEIVTVKDIAEHHGLWLLVSGPGMYYPEWRTSFLFRKLDDDPPPVNWHKEGF